MSYQSEVLADSPAVYWRLDVSGFGTNGESVPDISGNDRHGTLFFSGSQQCWGLASPIETDPASREFWGYTNASLVAGISGTSRIALGTSSGVEPSGDFTVETWLRPLNDIPLLSPQAYAGKRQTCSVILTSNLGTRFGGFCRDSAGTDWFVHDPSILVTDHLGESQHIVVTRLGNSLSIYRNGVLRNSTTITSGLPTQVNAGDVFVHPDTLLFLNARQDEFAFYTSALSGNRILAHYEAAPAVLPLRATITIRVNVELNTDQVTAENLGFPHNFSDTFGDSSIPIVEELSYKTNVNQSEPDYQQRINARPHGAYRSLEYHLSPTGTGARSRLHGSLYTPAETYCIPVWTDSGVLTAQASSGASTISCDTTKRDYQVGSYVGICSALQNPATYQFFKITAVADAQLTITTTIGTTVASGSPVFPARLATISDDSLAIKSYAADHEDTILRFDILESELSTRRITAFVPGTMYKGVEVFSLEQAKVQFLDSRPYDIARRIQGRDRDYQIGRDTGSPQTFPVRFLLTSRAALSEFFGWLDARQGKQNPLWVSTKERDLTVTAAGGNDFTVSPKTGFSFHHARRDVEVLHTDGSLSHGRVTAVTEGATSEIWTFDVIVPNISEIQKVSFLKYCTLAQDSVQIRYYKGGANGAVIAEATVSFKELLTSPA